jgi:hypothetical protein
MTRDRGQTTIDFAVGVGLFLLVVAFVVAFVPTMLEPFRGGAGAETVAADRVATDLSEGLLGSPDRPSVLDVDRTVAFFGQSVAAVREDVGLADYRNFRLELRGDVDGDPADDLLCWDEGADEVVAADAGGCDTTLAVGNEEPTGLDVAASQRSIRIGDVGGRLSARVW